MNFKTVATKIGLSIISLVLIVLFALYVSLDELFTRVLYGQRESNVLISTFAHVQWLVILAGLGAVLLASGLTLFLSQRLARPLVQMEAATKEISKGNYQMMVPIHGEDEIARLGRAINELALHLDHMESSRKEFLADISHELRTPLSYIRGYSQVLFEHLVQTESEKDQYLRIIYDESERIEQLIENLFSLAQADEGILRVTKETVDITHLIDTVVQRLQRKAAEKKIQIRNSAQETIFVFADPMRIEQVMFNLMDNAIRYNRDGGLVLVNMIKETTQVRITVYNTGAGIPEADLPFVWDRLYRVEKSRSRKLGGTGLGLAIVKQIVEQHDGTVDVVSQEGAGTTFSFTLPMVQSNGEEGRPS